MGLFSFFRRVRMGKCLSCEHEAPIRDFGKEYRDEYGTSSRARNSGSKGSSSSGSKGSKGSKGSSKGSGVKGSKRGPKKSSKGWATSSKGASSDDKGSSKGSSRFKRVEDKGSKGPSKRRTNKKTKNMNEDKGQKGPSYDKGAPAPSRKRTDSRHNLGYEEGAPPSDSRHDRGYEEGAPPSTRSYVGRTVTEDELKVLRKEKAIRDEETRILREKQAAEGYRDKGAPPPSGNGSDSRHNLGYEEGAPPSGTPPTGV